MKKILALDQSTKISGYSVFSFDGELLKYGRLEAKHKDCIERMKLMSEKIEDLIDELNPDFVVLEDCQYQRNWSVFQELCMMQGVILKVLYQLNLPFVIVQPKIWKQFCGIRGKARAEQKMNTQLFVKATFGLDCDEDESDALCIGCWSVGNIEVNSDKYDE